MTEQQFANSEFHGTVPTSLPLHSDRNGRPIILPTTHLQSTLARTYPGILSGSKWKWSLFLPKGDIIIVMRNRSTAAEWYRFKVQADDRATKRAKNAARTAANDAGNQDIEEEAEEAQEEILQRMREDMERQNAEERGRQKACESQKKALEETAKKTKELASRKRSRQLMEKDVKTTTDMLARPHEYRELDPPKPDPSAQQTTATVTPIPTNAVPISATTQQNNVGVLATPDVQIIETPRTAAGNPEPRRDGQLVRQMEHLGVSEATQ